MNDKKKGHPATTSKCKLCGGFVHGRGENGYPGCWDFHLYNKVPGLVCSGDTIPPPTRTRSLTPVAEMAGDSDGSW